MLVWKTLKTSLNLERVFEQRAYVNKANLQEGHLRVETDALIWSSKTSAWF